MTSTETETETATVMEVERNNNQETPKKQKRSISEHFEQLEQTILVEGLTSHVRISVKG